MPGLKPRNRDEAIQRMLRASGTNVLPINTHRLSAASRRDGLEIGFGGVTVDQLRAARPLDGMVVMLNINHQTTAAAAVAQTRLAYDLTGEPVVKLEVLNPDLRTSNDEQLIDAVSQVTGVPEKYRGQRLHAHRN